MATDPTLLGFGALLAVGGSVGYAKVNIALISFLLLQ